MLKSLFNKKKNFIKKRLQYRCFPVNIAKIFKNKYFEEHLPMAAFECYRQTEAQHPKQQMSSLIYWVATVF